MDDVFRLIIQVLELAVTNTVMVHVNDFRLRRYGPIETRQAKGQPIHVSDCKIPLVKRYSLGTNVFDNDGLFLKRGLYRFPCRGANAKRCPFSAES